MRRLLIIGGGIAGLAAAWYAERSDLVSDIVLLEQDRGLGGKIRSERVSLPGVAERFVVEAGAESFLSRKPGAVGLCRELGIDDRLFGTTPRLRGSFISFHGRLHPVPSGFTGLVPGDADAVLESDLLSPEAKRRFLLEPTIPPGGLEREESIETFMIRRYGRELFERLIEPLAGGIYAGNSSLLSIDATFPHLRERERAEGSLRASRRNGESGVGRDNPSTRGSPDGTSPGPAPGSPDDSAPRSPDGLPGLPPFLSLPDGMSELVDRLADRLARTDIRLGRTAVGLQRRGSGYVAEVDDDAPVDADAVIIATPAGVAGRLLSGIDPVVSDNLSRILYASSLVVNLAYPASAASRPLDGYGYVVPSVEQRFFTACTWTSSKWPSRAPEGYLLVRLYAGRFGGTFEGRRAIDFDDDEVVARAREELGETVGISGPPLFERVQRWEHAIPQYNVGHLERLSLIRERERRLPGIALAGAPYGGVGIPDCITGAREAVQRTAHLLHV